MEGPALADLTRRLEQRERDAPRWRAAALAVGTDLGLAVAVAAAPQAADQAGRGVARTREVARQR